MKEVNFKLVVNNEVITATTSDSLVFSQYDVITITADVEGLVGGKVLKFLISPPSNTTLPSSLNYSYTNSFYMIPDDKIKNHYYLRLNEILGNELNIGDLNTCNFKFQIITESGGVSNSENMEMKLYKTNTDLSYYPDDIQQLFIKISELQERVFKLQEKA